MSDFYRNLQSLIVSTPKKSSSNLTDSQIEYLTRVRKDIYKKLVEDYLDVLTMEDVGFLRERLRAENINFQDFIESINNSSRISIPTTIDNLKLTKLESYQIEIPEGLRGYMIKDKVREELQKKLLGNWSVGEIETLQTGNYRVKMFNHCLVSIPINISILIR